MTKFLTIAQVAQGLSLSTRQIHRMLDSGELVSVYFGRSRRIPATEYERYVDSAVSDARAEAAEVERGLTVAGLGQ